MKLSYISYGDEWLDDEELEKVPRGSLYEVSMEIYLNKSQFDNFKKLKKGHRPTVINRFLGILSVDQIFDDYEKLQKLIDIIWFRLTDSHIKQIFSIVNDQ